MCSDVKKSFGIKMWIFTGSTNHAYCKWADKRIQIDFGPVQNRQFAMFIAMQCIIQWKVFIKLLFHI